ALVRARRHHAVRRRRHRRLREDRPRPRARHDLAAPVEEHGGVLPADRREGAPPGLPELPAREVAVLDRQRRVRRRRARQGHVHHDQRPSADPGDQLRLHLLRDRAGAGADRRRGAAARRDALRDARDEDRAAGRRRLLEAARRRAHLRLRAADVHHRRRRPADHPADRHHAAVRRVRRLVGRRELPAARRAPARVAQGEQRMNKQISKIAIFALLLLAALIAATTYWQAWAAPSLAAKQDNSIQRVAQFEIKRGLIYASDGRTVLAANVKKKEGGQTLFFRRYPTGPLVSHVVGYSTQGRSRAGLERSQNAYLTASNANLGTIWSKLGEQLKGETITGNNLILNIKTGAQRIAQAALKGSCGAAVALTPKTGAVYVMASSPSYNPNLIESSKGYSSILKAPSACPGSSSALLNRATQGLYPPGSTFKTVTAAAALDDHVF